MKMMINKIQRITASFLAGMAAFSFTDIRGETIYKCMQDGKSVFTSMRLDGMNNCQPIELKVVQPNPVEVARQLEQKRLDTEEDRKEDAKKRRDKKQKDADESLRRAKSAKEAVRLLRENPLEDRDGNRQSWRGFYPHQGKGAPERFIVNDPPPASKQTPASPAGARQKP